MSQEGNQHGNKAGAGYSPIESVFPRTLGWSSDAMAPRTFVNSSPWELLPVGLLLCL